MQQKINDSLIVLDRMRCMEIFSEEFKKELDDMANALNDGVNSIASLVSS